MADTSILLPVAKMAEALDTTDLTTIQLQGTGVLDVLLQTMRTHLNDQFDKQRIRGVEYAETYLGAYTATLNAAISFLLSKERQGLEMMQLQAQVDLTKAQIEQAEAQTSLVKAQEEQVRAEMTKIPYEIQLIQAQIENMNKQNELADKQLDLLAAQINVQVKQLDLLEKQVDQAAAQTDYYKQKVITEKAQTDSSVIGSGSVIDSQKQLMDAQKDGYKRNAEQQAAQIITNTWNVRRQTDESTSGNTTNLLDDASVGKVVQTLAAGIGVTLTPA